MDELLFLAHRIPYPPDKGDKIRSWHFLQHLAERHRVHLGCFIDDRRDWQFTDFLRGLCVECCFVGLDPRVARLRSLVGLIDGRPLTLPYYFDRELDRWVRQVLSRAEVNRVLIYSSAMAQYLPDERRRGRHCVADLVDIDSQKWIEYAQTSRPPAAWIWRREGVRLQAVEREIVSRFDVTFVSTSAELQLLRHLAPDAGAKVGWIGNGVDSDYYSPERDYETPVGMGGTPLVFTGAMDYRPNIDAVLHFAEEILPLVRQRIPDARFYVVGSNPQPEIKALGAKGGIVVTGRVPDTRPYVAQAKVVVVPLRIARGIQNKVLEGMAMAKPVVASPQAMAGIAAEAGTEILVADEPKAFADAVNRAAATEHGAMIGASARRRVLRDYSWPTNFARLDAALAPP